MILLTDPASAAAAGRCLAARIRDPQRWITTTHPSRCGWCDYPKPTLDSMLKAFNQRVDFDERQQTDSTGIRSFRNLPQNAQLARIAVAQELVDDPPPAPGRLEPTPPPPPEPVEVLPPARPDEATPPNPPRPSWAGGPS